MIIELWIKYRINFRFAKYNKRGLIELSDLYLLFSHELTEIQKNEAYEKLGVEKIIPLPESLKFLWSQIPPDISNIAQYILPIKEWLGERMKRGDYLLVQGDYGATYLIVNWAFSSGYKPIYATTRRKVTEEHNNCRVLINRIFEHIRFRLYENTY